jgi:hypothetical protein
MVVHHRGQALLFLASRRQRQPPYFVINRLGDADNGEIAR